MNEAGEVSAKQVAWGFDQYVKQVPYDGEDGELACVLDAMQDYIKSAEKLKLAAASAAGSGAMYGATAGAADLVEALDRSVSVQVEVAIDLGSQGGAGCRSRTEAIGEQGDGFRRLTEGARASEDGAIL